MLCDAAFMMQIPTTTRSPDYAEALARAPARSAPAKRDRANAWRAGVWQGLPDGLPCPLVCAALALGGTDDAALSLEVQLHAGDLGQADRQPRGSSRGGSAYIESVGGKLHGFWYAFGSHDGYTLWEAPDNMSMAAVALAISGGGAFTSLETTVLLTIEETMDALRKAGQIQYRPPGT